MIKINNVYYIEERRMRLLYKSFDIYCLIDIDDNKYPIILNESHFNYTLIQYDEKLFSLPQSLTKKEKIKFDRNKTIISFINKGLPNLSMFDKRERSRIINLASEEYNLSKSQIRFLLIQFLKSGRNQYSLIPTYPRVRENVNGKKTGPKGKRDGVKVDESVKSSFDKAIKKYYFTSSLKSLYYTYERFLMDNYLTSSSSEIELRNNYPSYGQFYYYYNKKYRTDSMLPRYGEIVSKQKLRPLLGNSSVDKQVLDYEIDATIADHYTIDHNGNVVGRPIIYTICECLSQKIFVYVTFEHFMSELSSMNTILYFLSAKEDYYKMHDITSTDIDDNYLPRRLIMDRGEFKKYNSLDILAEMTSIEIIQNSGYRSDMKGIVEKLIGKVNYELSKHVGGHVKKDSMQNLRSKLDYRLKANMTIKQLAQTCTTYQDYHNNFGIIKSFQHLDYDGNYTPNDILKFNINEQGIAPRAIDKHTLLMLLLPIEKATVTPHGIKFRKLYYISKYVLDNKWIEKARVQGNFKINIKYHQVDAGKIYYLHEVDKELHILELTKANKMFDKLSFFEVEAFFNSKDEAIKLQEEISLSNRLAMYKSIDEIGKNNKISLANKSDSKRSRIKSIALNRHKSIIKEHKSHREVFQENPVTDEKISIEEKNEDEFLTLCKSIIEER